MSFLVCKKQKQTRCLPSGDGQNHDGKVQTPGDDSSGYSGEDSIEEIEVKVHRRGNQPSLSVCIQVSKDDKMLIKPGDINLQFPIPQSPEESSESYEEDSISSGGSASQSVRRPTAMVSVGNGQIYDLQSYKLPSGLDASSVPEQTPSNKHLFEECSICYSTLCKRSHNACYLDCIHWFHFTCIRKWADKSSECPVCRTTFFKLSKLV